MKKCPYCGQAVEDDACHCPKCFAGIPCEEVTKEKSEEVEESKQTSRRKLRS